MQSFRSVGDTFAVMTVVPEHVFAGEVTTGNLNICGRVTRQANHEKGRRVGHGKDSSYNTRWWQR